MQKKFFFLCFCFLSYLIRGFADDSPFLNHHSIIQGVNIITGQPHDSLLSFIEYEKYQEGWNQQGEQSVFLSKEDFQIGKVKTIRFLSSDQTLTDIHFSYAPGITRVYDFSGQFNTYHYSTKSGLLQSIEHYQNHSEKIDLAYIERFYWEEVNSDFHLIHHVVENQSGEIVICNCFFYDEQGQIIKETIAGNLTGTCSIPCVIGENGYPEMNGVESYSKRYIYSEENPDFPIVEIEDEDLIAAYRSKISEQLQEGNNLDDADLNEHLCFLEGIWDSFAHLVFSSFDHLRTCVQQLKKRLNAELRFPEYAWREMEKMAKIIVGESMYLLLMGGEATDEYIYTHGQREFGDKVRVTFINGILNTQEMVLQSLQLISESHGGVKVHYVFRPTEGWTWDISRAIMIKVVSKLGFQSIFVHLLVQMWRELIQEMGGVGKGGVIIHYAHSLGGTETDRARELLTPEEQQMIRVVTFGSATLVRNIGFQSVINIVAVKDGVCGFALDPIGHLKHYFNPDKSVHFFGSFFSSPYWPVWPCDHFLNGVTYGPIIQRFGAQFMAEFGSYLQYATESFESQNIIADNRNGS